MAIIIPANSAADTGYTVANSCRLNSADSSGLLKTGSAGNRKTFTLSAWVKRCKLGATQTIFSAGSTDEIRFESGDTLKWSVAEGASGGSQTTTQVFRDVSSFYHIVFRCDTTHATAASRMRLYVNGAEVTSFSSTTNSSVNVDTQFNTTVNQGVGYYAHPSSPQGYFDGYIAEAVMIDGSSLAPTEFGEFDSDSPTIWKPKDVSGLTFGTNGFYLDFEDSSNLGNDANGGTDLTETNLAAVDQATDTPTNNFCTLNPLDSFYRATWGGYSEGNTKATTSSTGGDYAYATTTIGLTAGKWYWEQKIITESGSAPNYDWAGVTGRVPINDTDYVGKHATGYGYLSDGKKWNNNSEATYGNTFGANDIISVALDLDNLKLYFAKNGTWQDSGDPTTGATGTGAAYTVTAVASTPAGAYFPTCGDYAGGAGVYAMNFGNPSYANSSDAADANGYGAFEYAPPSGYLAICTKNLGSDGG